MPTDKNPFSLYDFMGYFIPGAFMLFAIKIILYSDDSFSFICFLTDNKTFVKLSITESSPSTFSLIAFVIISYTTGHILSYVSSITIEYFSNKAFRYPSKYLLNIKNKKQIARINQGQKNGILPKLQKIFFSVFAPFETIETSSFGDKNWKTRLLRFIAFLLCLPATLFILFFAKNELTYNYITRPLDRPLIHAIKSKMKDYSKTINYAYSEEEEDCDSHRIIMHFVNVNTPNAPRKADNYVALYGFLRSMSLALSIVFNIALISAFRTIQWSGSFDIRIISALVILAILPGITYLGYLKFYRRHTLENFMSFLVTDDSANHKRIRIRERAIVLPQGGAGKKGKKAKNERRPKKQAKSHFS